jgi:hypothetical protein
LDTLYLLFCRYDHREAFIQDVLILNSFGTIEDYCKDSLCFYELCKAALIMGKKDKYAFYFDDVNNRELKMKLKQAEGMF